MRRVKLGLLSKVIIAIAVAIACSAFFPEFLNRLFVTINVLIGNFINFIIPLIIVGLIVPGIAEIGSGAGKLLGMTVAIAYISTLIAGFFSYFTCNAVYPYILESNSSMGEVSDMASAVIKPYFTVEMPPVMDVTAALIISFVLGLGTVALKGDALKRGFSEFGELITILIKKVIIPVLPLYIFTIFLKIGAEGQVGMILKMFIKVIALIFVMHIILLLFQFAVAGLISKKNPLKSLLTMLPAYMTALGTQSSAATIPVTLAQAKKNGINEDIAGFVIPLCATIHLSGSILKIVACAVAIMWAGGIGYSFELYAGFICMLGIAMVAAPGVPGGAIMASLGLLSSMLGFDETLQGLMIALYITMDSFGTAGNVTGDGAIAMIIDKIYKRYSMKLNSKELKNKLIDSLLRKGYNYDDIKSVLISKENDNE